MSFAAFFPAYLFAVMAWLNPALGCLLLIFIHRMTGGKWGDTLQPFLRAGATTVPFALLFGVPLLFGMPHLFPWAAAHASPMLARHPVYMSPGGYILRALIYAVVYAVLIFLSRKPEQVWTGPLGMIVFVVTTYLLSVDWLMALEPGWYSTGFPLVLMASQAVSALAFSIAAAVWLSPRGEETRAVRHTWTDLGNLMLASLMFWAYVSYAEFLIVWSGNLPAQANWYVHRNAGGWHYVLIALVLLNLLSPVLLLLSGRMKRRCEGFGWLTAGVVFFQVVYLYWLVLPASRTSGIAFQAWDFILPVAVGALFLFFYRARARKELAAHA